MTNLVLLFSEKSTLLGTRFDTLMSIISRTKLNWMKYSIKTVLILLSLSYFATNAYSQVGFWDDVDMQIKVGINSFHGDFDTNVNGAGSDMQGVPFPVDGFHFGVGFSKPIASLRSSDYKIRFLFGMDYISHRSPTVTNTSLPVNSVNGSAPIFPINIYNSAFGANVGISFEYLLTQYTSIEPVLVFNGFYHNPTTDGFYVPGGSSITLLTDTETSSFPYNLSSKPYNLIDAQSTRLASETYSNFIMSGKAGIRLSSVISGNLRYSIEYSYLYFLSDFFDNTSGAMGTSGTSTNDAMTMLSFGVQFPLNGEAAVSIETERQIVKVDRKKVAKIERIQNIANLVTSDDDLRELQRIMSDKILLYDTPGVRFNELASKTIQRRVRLADSDLETDMVELPGGSYIIGLTSVDELNIQVQGRKRITINPFMVDKYEVTNEQYKAFLNAMGYKTPESIIQANASTPLPNYGSGTTIPDLLKKAGFENLRDYTNAPNFSTVSDLLPDSSAWKTMGLDEVIPWNIYFFDPFYNDRPVVCVNWYQARLFAAWAGKRLLTESEWEYAARSGVSGRVYPWDGLDIQTKTGKYRSNFKQERGVYDADGYPIMAPVDAYQPNDFGLYNISGNVSEWVLDSWNPSYVVLQNVGTANFVSPSYTNIKEPRRIHRGGSWQSTAFYIGVGVRNFQNATTGTPFVGFRCAKSVTKRYY